METGRRGENASDPDALFLSPSPSTPNIHHHPPPPPTATSTLHHPGKGWELRSLGAPRKHTRCDRKPCRLALACVRELCGYQSGARAVSTGSRRHDPR
ncbi:unnamed protein product [Gadus morhua 'NCC']